MTRLADEMRPRPCLDCGALTLDSHCARHKRGSAWRELRDLVLARDGYACAICGRRTLLEVGRVIPKGSDELTNLRTLCLAHHDDKGNVRRACKDILSEETNSE